MGPRRFEHLACRNVARDAAVALLRVLVLTALVLVALGPALGPFARELGASTEHACACGMKPGTCGCPACARLLHQDDAAPEGLVAALGSCDDHGAASPSARLPLALVPPSVVVSPRPPSGIFLPIAPPSWVPSDSDGPPTPPPRLIAV